MNIKPDQFYHYNSVEPEFIRITKIVKDNVHYLLITFYEEEMKIKHYYEKMGHMEYNIKSGLMRLIKKGTFFKFLFNKYKPNKIFF